jgi:tetratricopeptide (TPR) repeat protein
VQNNSDEFVRLKKSGDAHCARKEYAIAAESYSAALNHGTGDSGLLFNFAYSLAQTQKHEGAVTQYRKAIASGSGAAAHNNLGNSLRKLGRPEEAREALIKAAKLNSSEPMYWRNLAACLAELKDPQAQLSALQVLASCEGATAGDWNSLGSAREQGGDNESALEAFRVAAHIEPDECAYYFNVGLMHERCGRTLDAYHSCRHSLNLNEGYQPAAKMIPNLETTLKSFAALTANQPLGRKRPEPEGDERFAPPLPAPAITKEIGPQDYINPYTLLNLSAVSKLPDASAWFDQPTDWDQLLGPLTRRRRTLKAELELNDGKLSWLPQLHITDEVVHRVLSVLDDKGWHAHHWAIFRLPLLNRFLMHGELDYFNSIEHSPYPLVAQIAGAAPEDLEHEKFVAFISAFFRHRWASAFKHALDAGNYAGVRALLATSAPVTSGDLEESFEPMRRHFIRRREELKQLEATIESGNPISLDAGLQPALGEASLLNILPAHLGSKLRDDVCIAYRSISIALANHRDDYIASERALKAAESFQASATIKQRLMEDRTALNGLLAAAAQSAALQKATALRRAAQKKSSTSSGVVWLVVLCTIGFFVVIGSLDSNKSVSSKSRSETSLAIPSTYTAPAPPSTAPSTYTAPPTSTAPSTNGNTDGGTYRVPSYITSELGRDKQAIDNEEAKAAALASRLERAKLAVDVAKAKAQELDNQLKILDAQVDRARIDLNTTSQSNVNEFNRKVNGYNAMLIRVRTQNELMNQAVDSYNAILELVRAQDRVVNQLVDDYNAKLQRYGR